MFSIGNTRSRVRSGGLVALVVALAACGGEGSGSGSGGTITPPVATAPQFTSATTGTVVENTTGTFYTATATDPQGDAISFSVHSGADAPHFAMDGSGNLRFDVAPNYDLPGDANADNIYEVSLRASAGGQSADIMLRVAVQNDREGVRVQRVATGLVEPVGLAFVPNKPTLLIAERGGRVLAVDPATGTATEDSFIRDNKLPGEILAIAYGFPDALYQEGIYLITHDPQAGLYLQAFNTTRKVLGRYRLGDPSSRVPTASLIASGSVFAAIGDPDGSNAQSVSSPYGKLFQVPPYDPYAGASVPPSDRLYVSASIIGDGVQAPGGFSPENGRLYLADRGSTVEHEISIFDTKWRPLDFGWPYYEGTRSLRSNSPAQVVGPTLAYAVGEGRKEGSGVVAGLLNDYRFFPALGNTYVFADLNGTIWSIPYPKLVDGYLHRADELEVRTEDFAPNEGRIDSPVAFSIGFGSSGFYILDADGEIFKVDGSD